MKVIKQEAAFTPISIVLESQYEVNWMHELLTRVGGAGEVRQFFDSIYNELGETSNVWQIGYESVFGGDAAVYLK